MFNKLQRSITGWPGGKPNADDTYRPERAFQKRKGLLFSVPILTMMSSRWEEPLIVW